MQLISADRCVTLLAMPLTKRLSVRSSTLPSRRRAPLTSSRGASRWCRSRQRSITFRAVRKPICCRLLPASLPTRLHDILSNPDFNLSLRPSPPPPPPPPSPSPPPLSPPPLSSPPRSQIFYHAPALVVISGRADGPWMVEDCALARKVLAACAADLGTCWIGFAQEWLLTPEERNPSTFPQNVFPWPRSSWVDRNPLLRPCRAKTRRSIGSAEGKTMSPTCATGRRPSMKAGRGLCRGSHQIKAYGTSWWQRTVLPAPTAPSRSE